MAAEEPQVYLPTEAVVSNPAEAKTVVLDTPSLESDNIYKIRDILFGGYMRDYEKRFARLDERLMKECAELREELGRRCDTLETYVKKEFEAVHDRLKTEQTARTNGERKLSQELRDTHAAFETAFNELTDRLTARQRELQQLILDQSKRLSEELRHRYADLSDAMTRQIQEMRLEKADRAALATIFTEMAMRLNHDWQLPEANLRHEP